VKKILIVDDQKTILITLEAILKQHGYLIFSATNSIDAFDKFNTEHIDLVVTDAIMPAGSSGYTLITSIRNSNKNNNVPIIMLTGKREKADVEKALLAGADDYIVKPIDPDILTVKIQNLIDKNSHNTEFVEAPVNAVATVITKTEIITMSEIEIKLISNIQMTPGQIYKVTSDHFRKLGIESVSTRVAQCEKLSESTYKILAQFVGLTDKELSEVRLWIRSRLLGNS
jgi:DNA-binding response OmpR family regulator